MTDLADGKLQLDEPAAGVARLTIANPERRGALDHEVLDALAGHARTLDARCLVIRGSGPVFSAGYDIGNLEEGSFERSASQLVAHPFHEAIEALEAYAYPGAGRAERPRHRRRPRARAHLRHPRGGERHQAGHAAGEAGADLLAHRAGEVHRRLRRGQHRRALLRGPNVDAERGREMGLVNEVVGPDELEERVLELAGEIASQRAPVAGGQQARDPHAARAPAPARRGARADRAARVLLRSEDFREGVRAFAEKRAPRWQGR